MRYTRYRDLGNPDELSQEFKDWVLSRHDEAKYDMLDTCHAKRHVWLFSRLIELLTSTSESEGGLPPKELRLRYIALQTTEKKQ